MEIIKSSRFWLGLLISALCMWLALRNVPFSVLFVTLAEARYGMLFPAVILLTANVVLISLRWKILLGAAVRLRDSMWTLGTGYLFNNIFPFRLGDVARVFAMSHCSRIPLIQVMSTAVVERLVDVTMVLLALLALLPLMKVPPAVTKTGLVFGIAVLTASVILVLLKRMRKLGSLNGFLSYRWSQYVKGINVITQPGIALSALSLSLTAWTLSICMYWCIILCFQPRATFVEAAFMVVALSFAVAVPSTPGFIGVFQLIGQQALVIPFGDKFTDGSAFCIALTAHLTYYLFSSILGVIGLWQLGSSFPGLSRTLSFSRTGAVPEHNTPKFTCSREGLNQK